MRGNTTGKGRPADSNSSGTSTIVDGLSLMQRGNEYFFSNCYMEATGYYYQAAMLLKASPEHKIERSKAWSNVAECHLRLQNWQAAADAASNAINADPSNAKALYRRAKARFELSDYPGAAKDADAVGTQDARDVAALCRELAHAEVARKLATGGGREGREKRERRAPASTEIRDPAPPLELTESEREREMWFRRIIDSYRLRVDDEYTQTGAADAGCLYGIQAKGLENVKSPMDHFQAYVNRAIKKRVLPTWLTVSDMEELCRLAANDAFSNINLPVVPGDILEYYSDRLGPNHDELQQLRDMAVFIEGPIGMPWKPNHKPAVAQVKEKKKPASSHRVVLEPRLRNASWNKLQETSPRQNKPVYDLSERYPSSRQPTAYDRRSEPFAYQGPGRSEGVNPPHSKFSYPTIDKAQRLPYRPHSVAPVSPKQQRPAPTRPKPSGPPDTRNRTYPYYSQDDRRKEQTVYDHHYQAQQQHQNTSFAHSPQTKKKAQPIRTTAKLHSHWNRFGLMFSEEKRSPSPCPITDSESTMSDEYRSFGPQLPHNQSSTPALLNQHSARRMMMSLMPSLESDDDQDESFEQHELGEFYSQEDTSTAQEVRHGLWRGEARDEFSELTELSP